MISYAAKTSHGQLRLSEFDRNDLFRSEVKAKKIVQCPRCKKHPEVKHLDVWLCDACWTKYCEETI